MGETVPDERTPAQRAANYRRGRRGFRCLVCPHFKKHSYGRKDGQFTLEGRCPIVAGTIKPNDVCDRFSSLRSRLEKPTSKRQTVQAS